MDEHSSTGADGEKFLMTKEEAVNARPSEKEVPPQELD